MNSSEPSPIVAVDTVYELSPQVAAILGIPIRKAEVLIKNVERLYKSKMLKRFTDLRFSNRLKRTNPFLLRVRGVTTVKKWAENQVASALFASEEEAIGHVLEMISKSCHPGARTPERTEDLDFEVENGNLVRGFQVKMSWDCMPMSSRKNLSNTILRLKEYYKEQGREFDGIFAPCYGRKITSKSKWQEYISLRSRDFWTEVGSGDVDYDIKVGEVCGILCAEFREDLSSQMIPELIHQLTHQRMVAFGTPSGEIDYKKLFRLINA